ncbi:MAG: tetratricopeptide repeat protein [Muribaculaceae bacterium]|nr:tetratricopeptide repeat protein [Muribaculaceae bacterium]
MNLSRIFLTCLAGVALTAAAQTHKEGVEYYKADQLGNAKELLQRNLSNPGTDQAVSNYYLGMVEFDNGNTSGAAPYFDKGLAANPDYGYNYVGKGLLELKKGNLKEAEKFFKEAEGKVKKDAAMQIAIARAYYDADPVTYAKQIEKYLEKARKTNMQAPEIYIFEGDMLADKKDWGGAAAKYEMAANYDQEATEAYVKYANLFTQVNPKFAITMLSKLKGLHPDSALAQKELAEAYYNNGDYANAASEYGAYVKNPNHFKKDEDRYAFLLFYGKDYQGGYDYSTELLKYDPTNFTAQRFQFMNAAQIPALQNQLIPMAEALLAAHRANPANKFAAIDYNLISDELIRNGRADEGIQVLQEAIAEDPENASFNKALALAYVNANSLANAADAFQGYIEKTDKPGYNDFIQQATYAYYAGVELKESDPARSEAYYDMALDYAGKGAEILPDNYKPKKFVGDVAKQRAAKDKVASAAQPAYEEAVVLLEASQDPSRYASDAKEMYNYLGNYYLDKKDVATAKKYFNKYLEFDPTNDAYRKFVDGLK